MGKLKFNVGDKVINIREPEKGGFIVGYNKETGEYQIQMKNGEEHYESPRWLEKESNNQE